MNRDKLKTMLRLHEGERFYPYRCTAGALTIGVGRNLDAKGISKRCSDMMLEEDIDEVVLELDRALPWWRGMSPARQLVLADMCFNLGITRLLGFARSLAAMRAGDYETAAVEMLDSQWSRQVGQRAQRLARMMREG